MSLSTTLNEIADGAFDTGVVAGVSELVSKLTKLGISIPDDTVMEAITMAQAKRRGYKDDSKISNKD